MKTRFPTGCCDLLLPAALALGVVVAPARSAVCAQAPVAAQEDSRMPGVAFDELARRAASAWDGGRVEEALRYFRAGVELNPMWADGWWHVGMAQANERRWSDCRDALRHLVELAADSGPGWALLGVCEFRSGARERALASLTRGVSLGVPEGQDLARVARHYLALLLTKMGEFGEAARQMERVAKAQADDAEFIAGCGLMALRIPRLPSEVPEADRPLVARVGRAEQAALIRKADEATRRFGELLAEYPKTRGVHLAYGLFLSREASPEAVSQLRKEVELFPDSAEANLQLAFELLDRGGSPDETLASARAAARLWPDSPGSHLALGRALLAVGTLDAAVTELERAEKLAPDTQPIVLALAQAYARTGRTADVERARARLRELEQKSQQSQ